MKTVGMCELKFIKTGVFDWIKGLWEIKDILVVNAPFTPIY